MIAITTRISTKVIPTALLLRAQETSRRLNTLTAAFITPIIYVISSDFMDLYQMQFRWHSLSIARLRKIWGLAAKRNAPQEENVFGRLNDTLARPYWRPLISTERSESSSEM